MNGSLVYKTYDRFAGSSVSSATDQQQDDLPVFQRLASRKKIEALIPEFVKAGIAIGDVP